ncbi:protein kinase [Sorangium sp. So ce281]|uniref:serine/threonine-protein kinase n=1 Tax=unclassified Sorangium TaxID=2621164 RepID=UPI003F63BC17
MIDEQGAASDAPDEPRQLGPYRIIERLGQGGMGVVFRAVHDLTGEEVAIKTVRGVNDADHLAAIRRETRVLRRLNHPGIVRFLDEDVTGGVPWVAMPLLRGGTLRDRIAATFPKDALMEAAITVPVQGSGSVAASVRLRTDGSAASADARSLGPMLTLIRRLCAPLAYLHGEGLVHRDLKPANIVLQDDERPVLVDLGIAVHFGGAGREELDVDPLAGSLAYTAPEQLQGEPVDARTDLYALGCILYECVTGRPPFVGDASSLCKQHRSASPRRPSALVTGLPAALDDLILTLLAKNPQRRVQYATDVATKLVALGAAAERDEGPPPRVYLYRPVLAGRTDAVCKLQVMAQRAASERRGAIALVRGESGSGKTRLVREVSRATAQGLPLRVFSGVCIAPGAGEAGATAAMAAPLQPLRTTLLAAIDQARASETDADRLFGGRREVLAAYVPELRALGSPSEPAPLPPSQARKRVVSALRETLRALAEARPLCLLLDDLQWADDLTLALLDAFARAEPDERGGVLIIGTYRMEETRPELEDIGQIPGATSIQLDKLAARDIEDMVVGMLSPSMPPRTVLDVLIRNANGNPFFVAEYLRAALDAGELQREQGGGFSFKGRGAAALASLQIPDTLDELLGRRLDLLDAEARVLAAWAAVLGQELDDELLFAGPLGQDATTEAVAELRARRILEETETARLCFVHDKLREKAYSQLDPEARAALHQRAGEALEARGAEAPVLAHHFAGAGLHGKAGAHFARAAQRAADVYANRDAVRFYRLAISARSTAGAAPAALAKLHEGLGDVLGLVGRQAEARDTYGAALGAATSRVDHARFHRKIGKTWEMHHQHARALECYGQAETALVGEQAERASGEAQAWWNEWIQIHLDRISVHYWLADLARLDDLIETVRPVLEQRGTPLHRAHYLHALTQRGIQRDRFVASAKTLGYADECVAAYRAADAPPEGHWALAARCSLAIVRMLHGDPDQAEAEMRDALSIAERSGDLEVMTRCLTYLTVIQRRRNLVEGTESLAKRTLKLARAENVREYAGAALGTLAWSALQRGDLARAEEAGREALACWEPLPLVYPFQWLARLPLCRVELARGRLEGAIEQVRAVLDPRQQRLPGRLTKLLEAAARAFAAGHEARACRPLALALRGARHGGYA